MSQPPAQPKIYHIVHVDRLASIVAGGCLWSDAEVIKRGQPGTTIGMSGIKTRRLALPVECHPGDHVGDFVPLHFCPRSIMLDANIYMHAPGRRCPPRAVSSVGRSEFHAILRYLAGKPDGDRRENVHVTGVDNRGSFGHWHVPRCPGEMVSRAGVTSREVFA